MKDNSTDCELTFKFVDSDLGVIYVKESDLTLNAAQEIEASQTIQGMQELNLSERQHLTSK